MATKKIKKVTKQTQKQKQKQKQTSKAIGNIVNINVPKPKRQYTRRHQSQTSQPSSTVITQIHQLPIPQYSPIEMLGINNLKNAQLSGELGLIRNDTINNGSPIDIGGNQDNKILTSAENISKNRVDNLLKRLNADDTIPVPPEPKTQPEPKTPKTPKKSQDDLGLSYGRMTKSGNPDRRFTVFKTPKKTE